MNSDEVQLVNCANGRGKVETEGFRKGRHYNVSVKICNNTRILQRIANCLNFWTPPEKPTFKEPIVISPSGNNKITLVLPSYKKQQKGKIYIVVIKGDSSTLKISDIEDYVKQKYESPQTTRTRRSVQEDAKPDIMVVDIVDINTEKYELKPEKVFKENETRTPISVAAVFAPEAGELRSYGSTGIIGPVTFPSDTSWVAWLIVCLLILIGGSVGVSIYLRR
ncbi:hypothetical protein Anas_11462 [Armadillidium nasatum]|uniref:Uncharacterized protein n=1 Tax=Armadillidium nasatum TaxID=96803 RepID=A0A5N5T315_9CRUS|nr:hypothetical protein Anas_11462 [Armadillidium nasatum]